jgi:hypothetical protein
MTLVILAFVFAEAHCGKNVIWLVTLIDLEVSFLQSWCPLVHPC